MDLMRVTVTTYDIDPNELAVAKSVLGLDVIEAAIITLTEGQAIIMANFDALNAKIDEVGTAITDAAERIDADFQALKDQLGDDANDQAAIDAATTKLQGSIDALKAIDPVPPVDPGTGEPTDPTDGGTGTGGDSSVDNDGNEGTNTL